MTQDGMIKRAVVFLAVIAGVYALHWAKDILIPLAIAALLLDLLAPAADFLVRRRIPNALAVILITGALAAIVAGVILLVSQQMLGVTRELPNYRDNIVSKVRTIRGPGPFAGLTDMARYVSAATSTGGGAQAGSPTSRPATQPVRVEVVGTQTEAMSVATGVIEPVLRPLIDAGIVFIYLFFLLLERELVGHRLRWLMRKGEVGIHEAVIEKASSRVARYLRMQFVVNAAYGVLMYVVFRLFGLPNAMLLAILAGLLRYIPYLGPVVAISLPTLLGIAVFPGWGRPLEMLGAMVGVEVTAGGFIEPLLYGSSTGVSSIGVVLSYFFWGWVWGPVGLILATPITAWIVNVGRYLPGVRPVSVLLGADSIAEIQAEDQRDEQQLRSKEDGWAE